MNLLAIWIGLGFLLFSVVGLAVVSRSRKSWYNVRAANPEDSELHVYRTGWDRLWRSDEVGLMLFHRGDGKEVRFGKHWIIKIEEE